MKRVVFLLAVFCASAAVARADVHYQQLDIQILTMAADRRIVPVGGLFHLKIHAHIAQKITQLDHLLLPDLSPFEQIGDERHMTPVRGGTDFDELLTLKALRPGDFAIPAASIDAINSKTMLASKFSTTDSVVVSVPPILPPWSTWSAWPMLRYAAIVAVAVAVAVLTYQIGGMFWLWYRDGIRRRRYNGAVASPAPTLVPAVISKTAVQRLRDAITKISHDPSVEYAEELRSALRDAVGAREEETLSDILARIPASDRGVIDRALRAAERAAFIDKGSRRSAIEDGLPIFELACQRLENR